MAANKLLSADRLFALVRANFEQVTDQRAENAKISMPDALMSGLAMFSLKDPSLLAFDERRTTDSNLGSIYGVEEVPGDTQMRTILDDVDPREISPAFRDVVRQLQRTRELDKFVFLGGSYLVSLDGTGYFSSKTIHCSSCMEKVNKKTGEVTYYHQLMGGVIIHPNLREVIPLMPEPILKHPEWLIVTGNGSLIESPHTPGKKRWICPISGDGLARRCRLDWPDVTISQPGNLPPPVTFQRIMGYCNCSA